MKQSRIVRFVLLSTVFLSAAPSFSAGLAREESRTIPAEGIHTLFIRDMQFADVVYRGDPSIRVFSIHFEKRADGGDDRELEDLLSEIRLDTVKDGSTLRVTLRHPRQTGAGILNRWFNRKAWKVVLEMRGPAALDIDANAGFSEIRISSTTGELSVSADFSAVTAADHAGDVKYRSSFGSFKGEGLSGKFDIDSSFSEIDLALAGLDGDSRLSLSFGSGEIALPNGAGAVFRVNRDFGGVTFSTSGTLSTEGDNGNRRVLNGGGPTVRLDTSFGDIRIRDNLGAQKRALRPSFRKDNVMPLVEGAWWRYARDGESMTLRVGRTRVENGRKIAMLSFEPRENAPFENIEVFETEQGLFLSGIKGSFFGRNLSGVIMNPPAHWLPYRQEDSPVVGGDIGGTVRIVGFMDSTDTPAGRMGNVISYSLESENHGSQRLQLVPGIGFVSFDNARLVSYSIAGSTQEAALSAAGTREAEPPTSFERGIIKSIEFRGTRMRATQSLRKILDLREGETYTKKDIDAAVKRVEDDPLIDYASWVVDREGNLRIRVYEIKPYSTDFGMDASFTRVSGLGLGPKLTITNRIGPISHVRGGAQYHWATKDWTWNAEADHEFFKSNPLRIGGGYRYQYGSNMDWAVPDDDADLNAFFLGEETKNYFHVEGGYGFLTHDLGDRVSARLEYFDHSYGSVGKKTNWSLFNRDDTKEENPSLGATSAGRITAAALRLEYRDEKPATEFHSSLDIERSYRNTTGDYPAYTRVIAQAAWNVQYWYDNLLKIRLAGGWANRALPDQRSFQLGGINTLRGFDTLSIPAQAAGATPFSSFDGGDRMFLANFDYFWGHDLALIFFGDVGGVWRNGEATSIAGLHRDLGIGLAFGSDFFSSAGDDEHKSGFRVNWAAPVGNVSHVSRWTVNFIRAY